MLSPTARQSTLEGVRRRRHQVERGVGLELNTGREHDAGNLQGGQASRVQANRGEGSVGVLERPVQCSPGRPFAVRQFVAKDGLGELQGSGGEHVLDLGNRCLPAALRGRSCCLQHGDGTRNSQAAGVERFRLLSQQLFPQAALLFCRCAHARCVSGRVAPGEPALSGGSLGAEDGECNAGVGLSRQSRPRPRAGQQ